MGEGEKRTLENLRLGPPCEGSGIFSGSCRTLDISIRLSAPTDTHRKSDLFRQKNKKQHSASGSASSRVQRMTKNRFVPPSVILSLSSELSPFHLGSPKADPKAGI